MIKFLLGVAVMLLINVESFAQGCVAIRSGCGSSLGNVQLGQGSWQVGTNFRYFKSFRHFRGKHEETNRVEDGTEVINNSFFTDFLVGYGITPRLSLNATLPFVYHDRSSMYEHGGNPRVDDPETPENEFRAGDRHETSSRGLADIRLGVSYWLLDPTKSGGNISLGLGVKLPSGNYRYQDEFYNQGDNSDEVILSGVDQSIQPGDGGFGYTIESQGFFAVSDLLTVSGNFYYLINPRELYELENRGRIREYSVPDQYAARLGMSYMTKINGLNLYAGGRVEGIPASDLIGGDEGFRRPGYVWSLEPGVSYSIRNTSFNLTVPIAVERNRTKNFSDKERGRHGDAAFADYLVSASVNWVIGKKKAVHINTNPVNITE